MKKYKVQVLLGGEAVYGYEHEGLSARAAAEKYDGEVDFEDNTDTIYIEEAMYALQHNRRTSKI